MKTPKKQMRQMSAAEKKFKRQWDEMGMEEVFSGGRDEKSMDVGMGKIDDFVKSFLSAVNGGEKK